jgi:peptidoglycan/xylan/chitin deacetylase (PgdA/CDA1 family)
MSFAYRLSAFAARRMVVRPARLVFERPTASFSFDDFPRSAFEAGAPILERYGAKATYYAAGTFCGGRADGLDYYDEAMLRAVVAAGHEVGCHSFSHAHGPTVPSPLLAGDLERNAVFLRDALGEAGPLSFAYPYGEVSPRTKRLAAGRFASCRGIHPGLNGAGTDLAQLRAIPLERRSWRAAEVERWIEAAEAARAWIVFFSHDVSDDPSPYGCTPAMLDHALARVQARSFALAPVRDALASGLAESLQA